MTGRTGRRCTEMPHENPWFLITSEEIVGIRRQIRILEDAGSEKCQECAGAIAGILTTVEQHLK